MGLIIDPTAGIPQAEGDAEKHTRDSENIAWRQEYGDYICIYIYIYIYIYISLYIYIHNYIHICNIITISIIDDIS